MFISTILRAWSLFIWFSDEENEPDGEQDESDAEPVVNDDEDGEVAEATNIEEVNEPDNEDEDEAEPIAMDDVAVEDEDDDDDDDRLEDDEEEEEMMPVDDHENVDIDIDLMGAHLDQQVNFTNILLNIETIN